MPIVVNLSSEAEAQLREKAALQGQDVSLVAAQLLASALEWEAQDSQEAIQGIGRGFDNESEGEINDQDFESLADRLADELSRSVGANVPLLSDYDVSRAGIYSEHP